MTKKANKPSGHGRLERVLEQAWAVRQEHFTDRLAFHYPSRTLPVSVTGRHCALNCAHCGAVYLKSMAALDRVLARRKGREKSYLVTGGCDEQGKVPLCDHLEGLRELAGRGSLNLHTGLVSAAEASRLGEVAAAVSFDFPGDDDAIARVYGLQAQAADYLDSYRCLQRFCRVVPHICIGLDGGSIRGEYRVLDLLGEEQVEAISLIIFRPTAGTLFSAASPPSPWEVAAFIAAARLRYPRTPLYLGCMRPGGRYREVVDSLAIRAGVNRIVRPAPTARQLASELGLRVSFSEECCSL